jgi:hypothetical protein
MRNFIRREYEKEPNRNLRIKKHDKTKTQLKASPTD